MMMMQGGHSQASGRRSATGDSGSMRTQFMLSYEVRSLDTRTLVILALPWTSQVAAAGYQMMLRSHVDDDSAASQQH